MVISTTVQWSTVLEDNIYLSDIFFRHSTFEAFALDTVEYQTKKQKPIITTYEGFLRTCLKSTKKKQIQDV